MAFQYGFLGHLTFVDYSWDVMEPVIYFLTYGTQIIIMIYFIITNQVLDYKFI